MAIAGGAAFWWIAVALRFGRPLHYTPMLLAVATLIAGFIVFHTVFLAGYIFVKLIYHLANIYERPGFFDVVQAAQARGFTNCRGPLYACAATSRAYVDPFDVDPAGLPQRYNGVFERWEPTPWYDAPTKTMWVQRYFDIKEEEDPTWLLSATSAIPFVFPTVSRPTRSAIDRRQYFTDGGLADNCPILPALTQMPDVVIVVTVNHAPIPTEVQLQDTLEALWRKWFFSEGDNRQKATEIRERWLESLTAIDKRLLAERRAGDLPGAPPVFDTPKLAPEISHTTILYSQPSQAVSVGIPILDPLTGTMTFTPAGLRRETSRARIH